MNLTLGTKGPDELLVFLVLAVFGKTTEASRAAIKSLGTFMQSLLQTTMNSRFLKDLLREQSQHFQHGLGTVEH